jgi:hypothetical protein
VLNALINLSDAQQLCFLDRVSDLLCITALDTIQNRDTYQITSNALQYVMTGELSRRC